MNVRMSTNAGDSWVPMLWHDNKNWNPGLREPVDENVLGTCHGQTTVSQHLFEFSRRARHHVSLQYNKGACTLVTRLCCMRDQTGAF